MFELNLDNQGFAVVVYEAHYVLASESSLTSEEQAGGTPNGI